MVTSRLSDFREFLERNIRSEISETGDLLTGQQWTPFWGSVENTFDTFKETFVGGNKPLYQASQVLDKINRPWAEPRRTGFWDIPPEKYVRPSMLVGTSLVPNPDHIPFSDSSTENSQRKINAPLSLFPVVSDYETMIRTGKQNPEFILDGSNVRTQDVIDKLQSENVGPDLDFLEPLIERKETDSRIITKLPKQWATSSDEAKRRRYESNEKNKQFLEDNPDYELSKHIPAEYINENAAQKANDWEGNAYDSTTFSKITITPQKEFIGEISGYRFLEDTRAAIHDYGYQSGRIEQLPGTIAGRIVANIPTVGQPEAYATGVGAKDNIEFTIDQWFMSSIGGPIIGSAKSTLPALRTFSPYLKTIAKQDWRDLGWIIGKNPSIEMDMLKNPSVLKFFSAFKKGGATADDAQAFLNAMANDAMRKGHSPSKIFESTDIVAMPTETSMGVFRDANTDSFFTFKHLEIPGGNKRYFKVEGKEEYFIRKTAGLEDTSLKNKQLVTSELEEAFKIEKDAGKTSLSRKELLGSSNTDKGILWENDRYAIKGLKLRNADIEFTGIREWIESQPEIRRFDIADLDKYASQNKHHIVANELYDDMLDKGEYSELGYFRGGAVTMLAHDLSETLGPRSTFNQSRIDAVLDPFNSGKRASFLNRHYVDLSRGTDAMTSGGYPVTTTPLTGQRVTTTTAGGPWGPGTGALRTDWRSDVKLDEDVYTQIRHGIRAFYGGDGTIVYALSMDELQSDWITALRKNPNVFKYLTAEESDYSSFWRSRRKEVFATENDEYAGTFRHTNITPTEANLQTVTDPEWGTVTQAGTQYRRAVSTITPSDERGSDYIKLQYDDVVDALGEAGYRAGPDHEMTSIARRADPMTRVDDDVYDTIVDAEEVFAFNSKEFTDVGLQKQKFFLTLPDLRNNKNAVSSKEYPEITEMVARRLSGSDPLRPTAVGSEKAYVHVRLLRSSETMNPYIEISFGLHPGLFDEFDSTIPFNQIRGRTTGIPVQTDLSINDIRKNFKQNITENIFERLIGRRTRAVLEPETGQEMEVIDNTKVFGMGDPLRALYSRADIEEGRTGFRILQKRGLWAGWDGEKHVTEDFRTKDEAVDQVAEILNNTTADHPFIPTDAWFNDVWEGQGVRFMMQKAALEEHPGLLISTDQVIKDRYTGPTPYMRYAKYGSIHRATERSIVGMLKQNGYTDLPAGRTVGDFFIKEKQVLVPEIDPEGTLPYEIVSRTDGDNSMEEALRNFDFNNIDDLIDSMETDLVNEQNIKASLVLSDSLQVLKTLRASVSPSTPLAESFLSEPMRSFRPALSLSDMIEFRGLPESALARGNNSDQKLVINAIAEKTRVFLDESFVDDIDVTTGVDIVARDIGEDGKTFHYIDLNVEIPYKATDNAGNPLAHPHKTLGDILRNVPIRQNKQEKRGRVLAWVDLYPNGKSIIAASEAANFGVLVHEVGHIFRQGMNEAELERVGRIILGDTGWNNLPDKNIWTVAGEEEWANAVERYVVTGQYKRGLKATLDRFILWIKDIYHGIKGTPVEGRIKPELRKFLDDFIDVNRPTEESIQASVPLHELNDALRFWGYSTSVVRTPSIASAIMHQGAAVPLHQLAQHVQAVSRLYKIDDADFSQLRGTIKGRQQAINELPWDQFQLWELENLDQAEPGLPLLPGMLEMEQIANTNHIVDSWERIARMPVMKNIVHLWNPSAAATDPLFKSIYVWARMMEQGENLTAISMANLHKLGSSSKVFGATDEVGRIASGALEGFNVNDIRSRPLDPQWRNLLTEEQTQWMRTAESLERAKLAMLKAEGINIRLLPEEEGGTFVYAGRRMFAKISEDGEVLDTINMGTGVRPGAKQGFERERKFPTMEEALANGYRYLPDEEALSLNINAAYKRVSGQRWSDYAVGNVFWTRTTAASQELKVQRDFKSANLKNIKALLRQLQQTKRGENIHPSTLRSLKMNFPQFAGNLDDISKVTLEHLINAGESAKGQPISFVPSKQMVEAVFTRVVELEAQVEALEKSGQTVPFQISEALKKARQSLAFRIFARGEAYKNFKAGKGFKYEFYRSARSILMEPREGLIDELIRVVGGVSPVGSKRKQGGLLQKAHNEASEAQRAFTESGAKAKELDKREGITSDIPSLSGHIFTNDQPESLGGKTGKEVAEILSKEIIGKTQGYEGGFANLLRVTTPLNAAFRFFALGADASPFLIHLVFLWGESATKPKLMGQIAKGFAAAIFNPEYQYKLLDENKDLLAKYPDVKISSGGRTEITEFTKEIYRAGYSRYKAIRVGGKVLSAPWMPFMRGVESMLDSAAIQLLKAFDHLAVDEVSIRQLSDYVNEIRGLGTSQRLGVSAKQRLIETNLALSSVYNRGVGALIGDLMRPEARMPRPFMPIDPSRDLRTQLARRSFLRGATAFAFITMAIRFAQGGELEDLVGHINPSHPKFMTNNIGNTEMGVGSKMRSIIKLGGQVALAALTGESHKLSPFNIAMDNPGYRFLRGQSSYVVGSAITVLTGRTYMGDRVWGEGMGVWDTTKAFGQHVFPGPILGPIYAQSALWEGGNILDRSQRATVEFSGGRAYPEGAAAIIREFVKDDIGVDYDEMPSFARKIARQVLVDKLGPIQEQRIAQGDETAMYWQALENADTERLKKEQYAIESYNNRTGDYLTSPVQTLTRAFYNIQNEHGNDRDYINRQYDMFQDDVEYDEDNPEKFVLGEWYQLYDKAVDKAGRFDNSMFERERELFWRRTLPSGESFTNYRKHIRMETLTTTHLREFRDILPNHTVEEYDLAHAERMEYLRNTGDWAKTFDKYGFSDKDLSLWK